MSNKSLDATFGAVIVFVVLNGIGAAAGAPPYLMIVSFGVCLAVRQVILNKNK
jgi:hypothetical protein